MHRHELTSLRFHPDEVRKLVGLDVEGEPRPRGRKTVRRIPKSPSTVPPVPATFSVAPTPALAPVAVTPVERPLPSARSGEPLLSGRAAAEKLGVCTATIYKLCETGELRHLRLSNAIRILPEDLERLRGKSD